MGQEDVIARRYAKGLAECAADAGEMARVRRDVGLLADILDPKSGAAYVPELADFLSSPGVGPADKEAAAGRIAEKLAIGETAANFLGVLVRHGRVGLMPRIARSFAVFAGELTGDFTAVVHTARALTDDQAARLARVLSNVLGGAVHLHQQVEPGLLAGAKVTVGDRTFDGSVLGKLERLKNNLLTTGARELLRDDEPAPAAAGD